MPTYAYRREDGTEFDFFQKMSDKALEVCPTTGQKVTRLISGGSGVLYKGEGWYVSDYKKKSGGPAATAATSAGETAPKPDVKAETPAAPVPATPTPKAE